MSRAQPEDRPGAIGIGRVPGGRPRALLALGAVVGLACAVTGLVASEATRTALPTNAVATVNGEAIRLEDFQLAVAALAADRRRGVDAERKRYVLQRLVDEELLIQRALELGLARHDHRVRADLVAAMIHSVVSEATDQEPSPEAVEAFYREQRDYFTQTGRLRLQRIFVAARGAGRTPADALARAREARDRLRAGEPFAAVRRALGDAEVARLPETALPPAKLQEYVGPTAVRALLQLAPGAVSEPVHTAGGYAVFLLVDRGAERVPSLEEVASEVRAELQRRTGDRVLRTYLDGLRAEAKIEVVPKLP